MRIDASSVLTALIILPLLPTSVLASAPSAAQTPPPASVPLFPVTVALWLLSVFIAWRLGCRRASRHAQPPATCPEQNSNQNPACNQLPEQDRGCVQAWLEARELRSLMDLAQVAIFRSSLDGTRFLYLNKACAERLGYDDPEQLLQDGQPASFYSDPSVRKQIVELLQTNGRIDNFELEFTARDGRSRQALMTATVHTEDGYIQGAVMDITQGKEAERQLRHSHTFLQTLLDALPTPIFFKDPAGRYQLLNKAFETQLGQKGQELLGKSVFDIAPRHLAEKYHDMDRALLESHGPAIQQYEYSIQTNEGLREVMFSKESMFDENGTLLGLAGVIMDITDRKRIENSLRRAEERYRALYMNAAEGIFTATADDKFIGVNPAMARMFGYDSAPGMTYQVTSIATQLFADPEQLEILKKRIISERVVNGFEAQVLRQDGEVFWVGISARGVFGIGDRLERLEGLIMDISAQKQAEEQLALMVITDPLTAIANRIGFNKRLEEMLQQANRSGCQIGLLFIDLDGFKPINDSYGHQVGDYLLQQVSRRLDRRLRSSDIAARMGGDEFAVLLWDVSGPAAVERISRELLAHLLSPYDCQITECSIGASIGASLYPHHGTTASELLSAADSAMYEAKRSGSQLCFAPLPEKHAEHDGQAE